MKNEKLRNKLIKSIIHKRVPKPKPKQIQQPLLNFIRPLEKIGSHDYYFMDDYIDVMVQEGLAKYHFTNEKMYYVNGVKLWPGDKLKDTKHRTICLNTIVNNNCVPATYFPLKYKRYLDIINSLKLSDNRNTGIMWCGSNYKKKNRKNYDLTNYCSVFGKVEFKQYVELLSNSKFCLCLPGFGKKCHREIEAMGVGTVPVFTEGCCTTYHNKLIENIHYVTANNKSDIKYVKNMTDKNWKRLSDNCIKWFNENVTPHGSYKVFKEILGEK